MKAHSIIFTKFCSLLLVTALSLSFFGCGNTRSANKVPPPRESLGVSEVRGGNPKAKFTPMVDILFIIDNSRSMTNHIHTLVKNTDTFVNEFAKAKAIDFRIGVMVVADQDSRTQNRHARVNLQRSAQGLAPFSIQPVGQLLSIKGSNGKVIEGHPPYVTRSGNFVENLKATLNIGVLAPDEGGPQFEESFSPVLVGLSSEMQNGRNKSFLRKGAKLVLFFLTDANDASSITADSLANFLTASEDLGGLGKQEKDITVVGVLAGQNCKPDPSGAPLKIRQLISRFNGVEKSLCENFGGELAAIGQRIRRETTSQVIVLKHRPALFDINGNEIQIPQGRRFSLEDKEISIEKSITVKYAGQILPMFKNNDIESGWSYNSQKNTIRIGGDMNIDPVPDGEIEVLYTPIDPYNVRRGKVNRVGGRK